MIMAAPLAGERCHLSSAPGGPAPSLDATPFDRPHANRRTREIINHLRLTNWRFTKGGRRPDIRARATAGLLTLPQPRMLTNAFQEMGGLPQRGLAPTSPTCAMLPLPN